MSEKKGKTFDKSTGQEREVRTTDEELEAQKPVDPKPSEEKVGE